MLEGVKWESQIFRGLSEICQWNGTLPLKMYASFSELCLYKHVLLSVWPGRKSCQTFCHIHVHQSLIKVAHLLGTVSSFFLNEYNLHSASFCTNKEKLWFIRKTHEGKCFEEDRLTLQSHCWFMCHVLSDPPCFFPAFQLDWFLELMRVNVVRFASSYDW